MSEAGPALRRGLVVLIAGFNIFSACIYVFWGILNVIAAFYETPVTGGRVGTQYLKPALFAVFVILYGLFLVVCAAGLLRERTWGWWAGIAAGGISGLFAIRDLFRHAWGSLAFDLVYAAVVIGGLLWVRRGGTNGGAPPEPTV